MTNAIASAFLVAIAIYFALHFLDAFRAIADALQRIANVKDAEFERRKKEAK